MPERRDGPGQTETGPRDALLFISTGLAAVWNRIVARAKELAREGDGNPGETEDSRLFSDGNQGEIRAENRP